MSLSFVRNGNNVVENPGPTFFSIPVVASQDLEVPGIPPPLDDPVQAALASLVSAGANGDWAHVLAAYNIKYLLLAREVGWQAYSYLLDQPGLITVADYSS